MFSEGYWGLYLPEKRRKGNKQAGGAIKVSGKNMGK